MADVKWIKLSTGLPDNRKIKQIRKLPNGDAIALMWVFLMCLAGETNDDGMVYFTPEIPYTDEMLADEFCMDVNTVRLALQTFERFGMLEVVGDIICLSSWEKWQATDELSRMKEQTRKRVAAHRERRRLSCNVTGNVTCNDDVTPCNATEKKREEGETEEEQIENNNGDPQADTPRAQKRFTPPALEDVRAYCLERGNTVDPERFYDYYSSNGWCVGKAKMKDWKAAVRNWERTGNQTTSQTPKKPSNPFLAMLEDD